MGVALAFPALEISTRTGADKHHVLVYGEAALDPLLQAYTAFPTDRKNDRHAAIAEALRSEGVRIPGTDEIRRGLRPDGRLTHPGKWMLGRTQIALAVAGVLGVSQEEARAMVLARAPDEAPGPDRYVDTAEAIRVARRAGGVPVLAHPFWEVATGKSTPERLLAQVETFVAAGLCGTEVRSYHYPDDAIPGGLDLPGRFGLLEFGGSDYHANGRSEPGQVGVGWEQFERIRRLVAGARPLVEPAPRFEAVTFDCGGTLVEHRRDPLGVAADLALPAPERAAPPLPEPERMWASDEAAAAALDAHYRALLGSADAATLVVRRYTDPANWRVFPEVRAVLGALRVSGVRLGVVANWQSGLPGLLEAHGLLGLFDFVVASAAAGAAKPDPAIFARAVALAGCPADRVLHVGDDPECDVAGADAAGLAALHADRRDPTWDLRRVLGRVLAP